MAKETSDQQRLPLSDLPAPIQEAPPPARRIYCNRDLKLDQIQLVGFDMDYTLAIYDQAEMDRLSIEATAAKLVALGYPRELTDMRYPPQFPIRGLLVDTRLGNVLKIDRYRYAKKAFHGTRELGSDERKRLYQARRIRPGTRRYHAIDTLYALSEVAVYAAVVDMLDRDGARLDYARLFEDVRTSIDEAHRDGSIKGLIAADPARHLVRDSKLAPTLHKLRSAGKKLFLLTNSEPEYTERIMTFLLGGAMREYPSWRNYFDYIIADARKPDFFTRSGGFEDAKEPGRTVAELPRGRMVCGGSLSAFMRAAGVRGDHVLYVGDHIYGDVTRAKKGSNWRTLMIIEELTLELEALEARADDVARLHDLEERRFELQDLLRDRQALLKTAQARLEAGEPAAPDRVELEAARLRLRRSVERLRSQLRGVDAEYTALEREVERAMHPFWGSPFKAESELSSFGEQVERFACLYTDRVTNLLGYSASHYFRGPRHRMAHEL